MLWPLAETSAQNTGTTTLLLRVNPEARLDPPQLPLAFHISPDGSSDVTTASAVVTALVRTAPGQPIRLTGRLANLNAQVRWTGSLLTASGGGKDALCSPGTLAPGAAQDLITGWQRSGTATFSLHFELVNARLLAPGDYSAVVQLGM